MQLATCSKGIFIAIFKSETSFPNTDHLHRYETLSKSEQKNEEQQTHRLGSDTGSDTLCVSTHPYFLPSVCGEVIHRDLHALALLEFAESVHQQAEIKGVWMVKVVIIISSQQLLFGRQNLQETRYSRRAKITPLTSDQISAAVWPSGQRSRLITLRLQVLNRQGLTYELPVLEQDTQHHRFLQIVAIANHAFSKCHKP